jgi:hypothetical protein
MTITDRDRKILWGRAGNRCSKCRAELIHSGDRAQARSEAVIGEECHIVSPRPGGPRARPGLDGSYLDSYDNLVLMCASDHSFIDQLVDDYPEDDLKLMKADHEAWVAATLGRASVPLRIRRRQPAVLIEVTSGRELLAVTAKAHESSLDHDDLGTQDDVDRVAGFLQNVFDWGEIWDDIEPAGRIQAEFDLTQEILALRERGWRVFAARGRGTMEGGAEPAPSSWDTAYVRVVRADSPEIATLGAAQHSQP